MNAQPITITAEQQAECFRFAEKAVHIVQREQGENRRLRTAHADVLDVVGDLRAAIDAGDAHRAHMILDAIEKVTATHAYDMRVHPLPPGVVDFLAASERCEGEPIAGGARG